MRAILASILLAVSTVVSFRVVILGTTYQSAPAKPGTPITFNL
jgi:hypothetical protein